MENKTINGTISLEELAGLHSLSLKTLRRWARERRFPLYRVFNRIRVNPEEFAEWLSKFHVDAR
jgi:excisionase family DNA binding protein